MPPDPAALAATKLSPPRVPPSLVQRTRLTALLDDGVRGPLTLLAAPAGAGKSALLSSWAAGRDGATTAWLSLDASDRDRRHFWRGILQALRRAGVADPLASLEVHPTLPVDVILPAFVNALDGLDEPLVLVLDDAHEIDGSTGMADIDRLLRHPSPTLRLVISTRADPALRLGRLRLAGELAEIRESDLAFTLEEAEELLRATDVRATATTVAQLWERTEGWAAGLRLAAMAMRLHPEPDRFVDEFAGDDSTIGDYLLAEVLAQQPPDVRDFLLRVSIVQSISAELANAITGRTDAGRVLTGLERDHALLSSSGGTRAWHRLHPLFAELLRSELAYGAAEEIPELHRRAAAWFEADGQPTEAVRHAAAAEDWPMVGRVVGAHWVQLLLEGDLQSLAPVLDRLPDGLAEAEPELALAVAGAHVDAGDESRARPSFRLARDGRERVPEARRDAFDLGVATVGLLRGRLRGDLVDAMSHARTLIDGHGEAGIGDEDTRALALANLGIAELWAGDARAVRNLEFARSAAAAAGRDWLRVICGAFLGLHCMMLAGRYDRAGRLCEESEALAARRGWLETWPLGITAGAMSGMALHRNKLDEADAHHARSLDRLQGSTDRPLRAAAAMHGARLLIARGHVEGALDLVQEAREWLRGWSSSTPIAGTIDAMEATLTAAGGDPERALAMLGAMAPTQEARVATALIELRGGSAPAALTALGAEASTPGIYSTRVEAQVLRALAHDALADHDAAGDALERALDLAEPGGLRRPFLIMGPAIGPVLRRQQRRGTGHRALLDDLVAELDAPARARHPNLIPERLSDRESAVLRFLPTMMSNQEIAGELYVSVNTVKTHLKSIYRKLDVEDRRGAVRRARELSLLGPP